MSFSAAVLMLVGDAALGKTRVSKLPSPRGRHQDSLSLDRPAAGLFMDYAGYRRRGLPVGSGVTEAACKTVFTQRRKRSSMRWGREGGQVILDLRVLLLSGVWDSAFRPYLRCRGENLKGTHTTDTHDTHTAHTQKEGQKAA